MFDVRIIITVWLALINIQFYLAIRLGVSFKEQLIVPNALENAPQRRIYVSYNHNRTVIRTGSSYGSHQINEEPFILWQCREQTTYTIMMTCLDETLPNKTNVEKQVHWWLVSNIQNCSPKDGDQIFPYQVISRAPMGGNQRVVILAFTQGKYIDKNVFPNVNGTDEKSRESFTIKQFVNAHTLGNALAGNFFTLAA